MPVFIAASQNSGSAIIHSMIVEALADLAERGITPPVLPSANLENTTSNTIKDALRPYAGRIRYIDIETELD